MSMRNLEAAMGAGICLLALGVFFWGIPAWVESNEFTQVPPDLLPRVAVGLIALLGALLAMHRLFLERDRTTRAPVNIRMTAKAVAIIALFAVAVTLMTRVGFVFGGAFIVAALMLFMGARRWLEIVVVSIAAPAVLYALFDVLLGVPLP